MTIAVLSSIPSSGKTSSGQLLYILTSAKKHNLTIISAEDIGDRAPWEVDMTGDILLVVGAEREGISLETIQHSDYIVKLPMDGFVPSYNLQVAVSVLAIEALRQRKT